MIKRYIKLLTALIIVAVLAIGAYIGVSIHNKNEIKKAYEDEQKKTMFSFSTDDIKSIVVRNASGDYKFGSTSDGWVVEEGSEFPLNHDRLATISTTLSELTAERIITEELPENLSGYGLDNPEYVGALLNDGTEMIAEIGSNVPGTTEYYARKKGEDTIYVISSDTLSELAFELADLKDKLLFDVLSTDMITAFKYIDSGTIEYDLRKEDDEWKLFTPFPQGSVNGASVTNILTLVIRAECVTFIDEELNDPAKFGFNNPKYQVEIEAGDKKSEIVFGNYYDENEQYIYAYNRDLEQIYIFEAASLGFIGTRTEDILNTALHNEFFGNIKSYEVNAYGQEIKIDYQYSVAGEGETYYAVNGQKVDDNNDEILEVFNNMINSLAGLRFDTVCENVPEEELKKEPAATITCHVKEGDDYKMEFIPSSEDENMLYIVENGKYLDALMKKEAIERGVLMYYEELMEMI